MIILGTKTIMFKLIWHSTMQVIKEGDQTRSARSSYRATVHVDTQGNMIIVQNPTLAPMMETSDYEPKAVENDSQVDADTVSDATAFLETFFKVISNRNG